MSGLVPGSFLADKYRIERVLGQGGMGVVVAATHLQLQQQVAIKMLLPELAGDSKLVARFLQEGRSQVRIQGEHVVRVLDVGTTASGAPYLVMELLAGTDLGALLETRGALPVQEAVDYVLQAAEALAEAHALGIVHRDLKPQNLFLTTRPDGSALVKVLDFGIAKNERRFDATRPASNTADGTLLGSPSYMSPEQIRDPSAANAQSDIWSLGVILYELLTGRVPYESATVCEVLIKISRDPPINIRFYAPKLTPCVAAVVMRCLSRDPGLRPRDVAELALLLSFDDRSRARAARVAEITRRSSANSGFAAPELPGQKVEAVVPRVAKTELAVRAATLEGSTSLLPEVPMSGFSFGKNVGFFVATMAAVAVVVTGVTMSPISLRTLLHRAPTGSQQAVLPPSSPLDPRIPIQSLRPDVVASAIPTEAARPALPPVAVVPAPTTTPRPSLSTVEKVPRALAPRRGVAIRSRPAPRTDAEPQVDVEAAPEPSAARK